MDIHPGNERETSVQVCVYVHTPETKRYHSTGRHGIMGRVSFNLLDHYRAPFKLEKKEEDGELAAVLHHSMR